MTNTVRKIRKAIKSLGEPAFRRALRLGVAPSHEHREILIALGDVRTVLDVGANVGQFALIASRCFPNAQIHSFEPMPKAARKFEQVMNTCTRVKLHRNALGRAAATLPIHITARADSSSLLVPYLQSKIYPGTHEVDIEKVNVLPLEQCLAADDIVAPALLKIDVQGYEQQVLGGCGKLLQCFDWIFVELSFVELYAGQALAPEVISWLAGQGFALHGVYTSEASYKEGRMIQGDFLFRSVVGTEKRS